MALANSFWDFLGSSVFYVMNTKKKRVLAILATLKKATKGMTPPASYLIAQKYGKKPFLTLIGCLLSLRTKDSVSFLASCRLFDKAQTPYSMLYLSLQSIEKLIFPVGFYRVKARSIHAICDQLIYKYNGKVPGTYEQLITLSGVGPKTANLVLAEAFDIPALCVDTHVHRISNRLGIVKTTTPEQTEKVLKEIVSAEYWRDLSALFVMWGQNQCVPISPFCSRCPLFDLCNKTNVLKSR